MQLKYGTYAFDAGSCEIRTHEQTVFNEGGQPYKSKRGMQVHGFLNGDGQSDLTQKTNALLTALAVPYRDLILYRDDGGQSATKLLNATSLTGVVITKWPEFASSKGAEYATYREFTFEAEAEYALPGSANLLLEWHETVQARGGGPLYVFKNALNGKPQKQLVYPDTPYEARQSGYAVGFLSYPIAPGPLWPADLMRAPEIVREDPKRLGNFPANYQGFKLSWAYEFKAINPFIGVPHRWI